MVDIDEYKKPSYLDPFDDFPQKDPKNKNNFHQKVNT